MRIAVCLHGQPRDYITGFKNLTHFLELNSEHTYDFFIHSWIDSNKMECSPWRKIDSSTLVLKDIEKVKNDLLIFYKPIKYEFQESIKEFHIEGIESSIAYKNTQSVNKGEMKLKNMHNTFSQFYSRNRVRNLLNTYIQETDIHYDLVISTRIDFFIKRNYKIKNDTQRVYVSGDWSKRKIILDYLIISPLNIYLTLFTLYDNLKYILNSEEINISMKSMNEILHINSEELLTAFFFYYFNFKDIVYDPELKGNC